MKGKFSSLLTTCFYHHKSILVRIEVYLRRGIPNFQITGVPSKLANHSKERIRAAIEISGYSFPMLNTTIHLSPQDILKKGSHYDLGIALGILLASGQLAPDQWKDHYIAFGELSLDGKIQKIPDIARLVDIESEANYHWILPEENKEDAIQLGIQYFTTFTNLSEFKESISDKNISIKKKPDRQSNFIQVNHPSEENEITKLELYPGQLLGWEALVIALAGNHHILLTGSPGSGKTLLGEIAKEIQSSPSDKEWREIIRIYSKDGIDLNKPHRPFRSPHHSITSTGLIGGGSNLEFGEISLSHNGILFLDEIGEISSKTIQALREPLEKGIIQLTRNSRWITLPASFQLLATSNLCPCGQFSSYNNHCICKKEQIRSYLGKLTGPILDRIDIVVEIFHPEKTEGERIPINLDQTKQTINNIRLLQQKRKNQNSLEWNSHDEQVWIEITKTYDLGYRERNIVLKLARTVADMKQSFKVTESHLLAAISLRDGSKSIKRITI